MFCVKWDGYFTLGVLELMKFELTTLDEYSDETLLAELRRVADSLQGQRLTRERFDSLGRVHSSTLHNRFGSWAAALDKAGISESVAPRFRVLNREAVLEALREFAAENPGKSATMNGVRHNEWVQTRYLRLCYGS